MLTIFLDVTSISGYLAFGSTCEMIDRTGSEARWLPVSLGRSGSFWLVGEDGMSDEPTSRGAQHKAARKRHLKMDALRYARRRGLEVVPLDRSWNTELANRALVYANRFGVGRALLAELLPRFWRAELDIESVDELTAVFAGVLTPAQAAGFAAYADGEGVGELAKVTAESDEVGIIDSPAYLIDGELFFGRQHLVTLEAMLMGDRAAS